VLPNPRTRVRLQEVGDDETTRFINANFIKAYNDTPRRYIAAQGPLPNTVGDFWRMVWEKNSRVVVMVTGLVEKGTEKCTRYWPRCLYNHELNVGDVQFGEINIAIVAGYRKEGFITSKFRVRKGEEEREVWHFWYDAWPDHGVTKNPQPVLAMLKAVRDFSDTLAEPWVVHCSAGVGRTGCFIAVDHGLRQFDDGQPVDVCQLITRMRQDRCAMVQHPEQAQFVWNMLNAYKQQNGGSASSRPLEREGTILRQAVTKAAKLVPPKFTMHPSQVGVGCRAVRSDG